MAALQELQIRIWRAMDTARKLLGNVVAEALVMSEATKRASEVFGLEGRPEQRYTGTGGTSGICGAPRNHRVLMGTKSPDE